MRVKVLNNLSYQTFPATDDMIEVDDELVLRVGIDKQFDKNGNIIDYDNNNRKLEELTNWFKNDYTTYEQMFTRRKTLGIEDIIEDEFRNRTGENAYHNLIELYEEAEVVAKEIRELRKNVK